MACDVIHETVAKIQNKHPSAFIAITGDFNNTDPSSHLTGFVQYVDCPTRENKTLDLFYGNVKEAYTAAAADLITIWFFFSPHTNPVF